MGAARTEQHWQEFLATGRTVIKTSSGKAVFATLGILLLAALSLGLALEAYGKDGLASFKLWGCGLLFLLCLLGAWASMSPLVKAQRVVLERAGFFVDSRRRGERRDEIRAPWGSVDKVVLYRTSNGENTSTDARVFLIPGQPRTLLPQRDPGYLTMPSSLRISKKDLVELMERIRLGHERGRSHAH